MTKLAERIATALRGRTHERGAITAGALAVVLKMPEREVRRVIADEYLAISREAGGLLLSAPGRGFYITSDADEIIARHRLLKGLSKRAQDKVKAFEQAVREFRLQGVLNLNQPVLN